MQNLHDMYFTFNSSISGNNTNNFKVFLDNNGNIIDKNKLEYGVYNKVIKIQISKLLLIQKNKLKFGDVIDFFTKKLYIKNLIMYLTNGNCGCEERRIKFNKFYIPWYSLKFRELYFQDEELLNYIKNVKKSKGKIKVLDEYENNKLKHSIIKNNLNQTRKTDVDNKKHVPIDVSKIKKSCNCSRKNI
jgi:hypothetical protein